MVQTHDISVTRRVFYLCATIAALVSEGSDMQVSDRKAWNLAQVSERDRWGAQGLGRVELLGA